MCTPSRGLSPDQSLNRDTVCRGSACDKVGVEGGSAGKFGYLPGYTCLLQVGWAGD